MRLFILIIGALLSLNSHAGGGIVGNGGDAYSAEFVLTARLSLKILKERDLSGVREFDIDKFAGVIESTEIHSDSTLVLNGHEVDAINYPSQKLIMINRSRWSQIRGENGTVARFNLVLHEYLGIMRADDSTYAISAELIKLMSPAKFSTDGWWNPMNPTNNIDVHVYEAGTSCSAGDGGIKFDLTKEHEMITYQACRGYWIQVEKTKGSGSFSGGVSSEMIYGTYHSFKVRVYNSSNINIGSVDYQPQFGRCLISTEKYCSQSGTLIVGPVSLSFYFVR